MNNKSVKAIIIDDSSQARKLLRLMLLELALDIEVLAEAANFTEGIENIKKHSPDVVFLDIEMPGKSGIQLAEELLHQKIYCDIIFTTAYDSYAINAFRLSAIDYLLKPINEKQLVEAVEKSISKKSLLQSQVRLTALTQNLKLNTDNVLCIPIQSGYEYLPLKDIEYFEADGSYVHLYLLDKKHKTVSKNLKYFEQALSSFSSFVRVHRTYVINIDQMSSYSKSGRGEITMKNGKKIDLARDRRSEFIAILEKFKK